MKQKLSYKNPYPGIRSFNTNESALFFGRDNQINELLSILSHSRFAAISGASGSGKSSLIKAGLIPGITKDKEAWEYFTFRPGNSPAENMAIALHEMLSLSDYDRKLTGAARSVVKRLVAKPEGLIEYLEEVKFPKKLLIYIDQFEEIFRYIKDEQSSDAEKNAQAFIDTILHAVKEQKNKSVYVIISLRSDFLGECSQFSGLSEVINTGHYLIPGMSPEQKLEAVIGPAGKAGALISEALMKRIEHDIKHETDNLLVLQHAMMRTWDNWLLNADPTQPIDIKHYEAVGTVSSALSVHAEMIYNGLPDEEAKKITERVFKALTELGEDKKGIRRPSGLRELSAVTGYPEPDILDAVENFRREGNSFLMPDASVTVTSDTIIDISHESIMRVWQRLANWVSEETKSAETYLRLSKSAELYQEGKAGLLINPDLQLALQWMEDNQPNRAWAERYDPAFDRVKAYINYSEKEYRKQLAANEVKQKRQLKRTRFVAIFLGTASLISIFFLVISLSLKIKAEASENKAKENEQIALTKSKYAEEQKRQAVSNELISKQQQQIAEQHRLLAEEQKEIALIQRAIANREKNKAIAAMKQVSEEKKKVEELLETTRKLRDIALAREKEAIAEKKRAIAAEKRAIAARKLAASRTLAIQSMKIYAENEKKIGSGTLTEQQKQLPAQLVLYAYHFFKNNSERTFDTDIYNALLTNAEENIRITGAEGHAAAVRKAVFSDDGSEFASISDDRSLKLYSAKGKLKETYDLNSYPDPRLYGYPLSLAFAPDQKHILVGDNKGNILIFKKGESQTVAPLMISVHNGSVNDILFINEKDFVSIGNDGKVFLHSGLMPGTQTQLIFSAGQALSDISADSEKLNIAVASKNTLWILKLIAPDKVLKVEVKDASLKTLAWGKEGQILAGTDKGKMYILKNDSILHEFYAHSSGINSIIYNDSTDQIYTCSYDQTIKIWDYDDYDYETVISPNNSWILNLDYCKSSQRLLASYENKTIELISLNISELTNQIKKKVKLELSPKLWKRFIGDDIDQSRNMLRDLYNIQ